MELEIKNLINQVKHYESEKSKANISKKEKEKRRKMANDLSHQYEIVKKEF